MTAKKACLLLLLIFITSTAAYLAAAGNRRSAAVEPPDGATPSRSTQSPPAGPSKVVAYYFHVTVRCTTCKTIEAYSRDAVLNHFRNEIDRGRLEWHVVNVQLPENRHFIQDYQLFTKSVVLVHVENGKQRSYKILNDVWQLVGDKGRFQAYVDKEVRGYLARL